MADNITGGEVKVIYYGDVGRGRLSGTLQPGEVDLTSLLTNAKVNSIYSANPSGGFKSFVPGSNFNSLQALEVGEGYFIDAKTSFELPGILPKAIAAKQATALDYFQQGAPDKWIDKSNTLSTALRLYYVGSENKNIVDNIAGVLKSEDGSPDFSYITIEGGRAIAAGSPDDYITLDIAGMSRAYNDFTLMFAGRVADGSNNSSMVALLKGTNDPAITFGGTLPTSGLETVVARLTNSGNTSQDFSVANQYAKNTYSTYVVRRSGTNVKLFRNGLPVSGDIASTVGTLQLNGKVIIGRTTDSNTTNKAQTQTALIAFHGRSLSDAEILTLHTDLFNPYYDIAKIADKNPPAPNPNPNPSPSTVRAVAIHNSLFDSCGVYANRFIPMAATKGKTYIPGRRMIPGAPLEILWNDMASAAGFSDPANYPAALSQQWDKLILQPFDRGLGGVEGDVQMSKNFMNLVIAANPNVDVYIYSHWMRQAAAPGLNYQASWNQPMPGANIYAPEFKAYYEALVSQLRADYPSRAAKIMMIPQGDIMNQIDIRMRAGQIPGYGNIFDLYADGIHLNDVGSYLAGLGLFATIFRESPVGLATTTYNFSNPTLGTQLANAVWSVVNGHPYSGVNV